MTRARTLKSACKSTLVCVCLALAVAATIPLLAGLALALRLLVPVMLCAVIAAWVAIPAFRRWFMAEADNSPDYHGMAMPTESLWVHPAHAWARIETSGLASIGTDRLALAALGSVTAVQAPGAGTQVRQGQTVFTLRHGQRTLEVKTPVSGTIAEVNQHAVARPALLHESTYGAGWVVRVASVGLASEQGALKHGLGLRHWWRDEVDRFIQRLRAGGALPTMADGGVLVSDVSELFDDLQWNEIARDFFGQGGA